MEYYKSKLEKNSNEESFNLAFKIPGFNKILQSAGRLHRKPEDKGIIFLLGERFGSKHYSGLFPQFMHPLHVINSAEIENEVSKFWA